MPQLPTAADLGGIAPRAKSSVASYDNASAPGRALAGIGAEFQQMAEQEAARMDDLRITEATTKLRQREVELTYGKDGYVNVRGGDAMSRPLGEDYGQRYDQAARDIGAGLTGRQRAKFQQAAGFGKAQFQAGVMRHALGEADKMSGELFKTQISTEYDAAVTAGGATDVNKANIRSALQGQFKRLGITDSKMQEQMERETFGGMHAKVIDSLITNGSASAAKTYLEANKKEMTVDQRHQIEQRMKPATDNELGTNLGTEVYQKIKGGMGQVDADMWLTQQSKGQPGVMAAAKAQVAYLQAAEKTDDEKKVGGYMYQLMTGGKPKELMSKIAADPSLNEGQRAKALAAVVQEVETRKARARADQNFAWSLEAHRDAELANSQAGLAKYAELSNDPIALAALDKSQIAAYVNVMGKTRTNQLFAMHDQAVKGIRSFRLDPDIEKSFLPEKLQKPQNDKEMAQRNAAIALMTQGLQDWKDANPGKLPTHEQQRDIAYKAVKQQIATPGVLWGTNETPAYAADPAVRDEWLKFSAAGKAELARKGYKPDQMEPILRQQWLKYQQGKSK